MLGRGDMRGVGGVGMVVVMMVVVVGGGGVEEGV